MKRETKRTEVTITGKVEIPRELYDQYEQYAKARDCTVEAAIRWALYDWMMSIGQGYLEDIPVSPTPSTMSSKADAS